VQCRRSDAHRAKYELTHTLRTHLGNEDEAFLCMGTGLDSEGKVGVFLRKSVTRVAVRALFKHLRQLAPTVLPIWEQVSTQFDSLQE
jgi:3-ketoacyl-CoA synthase